MLTYGRSVMALTSLAAIAAAPPPAQFDAATLIDDALRQTQAIAYRRATVDWPALRERVRPIAEHARDAVDLLPAYQAIVTALGDGHSFVNATLRTRAAYRARYGRDFDAAVPLRTMTSRFRGRIGPSVQRAPVERRFVAILTVPAFSGGGAAARRYATTLADGVARSTDACGFVVDLRGNTGGNVWPMLLGVHALLGDGPAGRQIDAAGQRSAYASVRTDRVTIAEGEQKGLEIVAIDSPAPHRDRSRTHVAVLIDDATASSGEGVAVAFSGRPRTRFFGARSYGAASSNEGFVLADGVNIVVTTAMMADRRWRTFPNGIAPDVAILDNLSGAADAARSAAIAWLSTQAPCRRSSLRTSGDRAG